MISTTRAVTTTARRAERSGSTASTPTQRPSGFDVSQAAGGNLATLSVRSEQGPDDKHREGDQPSGGGGGGGTTTPAFPTAARMRGLSTVLGFCIAEWNQTKADATQTQRRERGFWIQWNRSTDTFTKTASIAGSWRANNEGASVNLGSRPADNGDVFTVASFHTHTPTFYRSQTDVGSGRPTGPSQSDYDWDRSDDVAGLVFDYAISVAPAGHPLHSDAVVYTAGTQRTR